MTDSTLTPDEYDIFYVYEDGRKCCVSWPKFKSALDAAKSLANACVLGIAEGCCASGGRKQ